MKKTILTGVQSTGIPHLGNILGSIIPAIELSKLHSTILFVADIHSLTTITDPKLRHLYTKSVASAFISLGFDINKNILFKQSDRPESTELQFYLNCFTPFTLLQGAHAFKDKENVSDINVGVFTYPTLMAADILLYDTNLVPVGKDQLQHLQITRDIARKFNNVYGDILTIPEPFIQSDIQLVPGIDGRKMSKSYGNTINIFADEKEIVKQVKSIITDSTPVNEPKNPETCNLFNIFKLIADQTSIDRVYSQYVNGGLGYGTLKMELAGLLIEKFKEQRIIFSDMMKSDQLTTIFQQGSDKAKLISDPKIKKVREVIGF